MYDLDENKYQEKHALFFVDTNGNVVWIADASEYDETIFDVTLDNGNIKITNISPNNLPYKFKLKKYI